MRVLLLSICMMALALSGCKDDSRSGYLELSGRIFVFNPRIAVANYVVTANLLRSPPEGAVIVATFEDPAGGPDLTMQRSVVQGQKKVSFESDPLKCIRKGKPYRFTLSVRSLNGMELQSISSSITSDLDQSVLPDEPLVVGPAYEPNPALRDNTAGKLLRDRAQSCPP